MKNKFFTMRARSEEILTKGMHLHHQALHFLFFRITDCSCFFEFKFSTKKYQDHVVLEVNDLKKAIKNLLNNMFQACNFAKIANLKQIYPADFNKCNIIIEILKIVKTARTIKELIKIQKMK